MKHLTLTILFFFQAYALVSQSAYTKEAANLIQNGKFNDAITVLNQVKDIGKSSEALFLYGVANYHSCKYKTALIALQESVRLAFNPLVRKYLGMSMYALGLYEEAAANYRIYLSGIDPKHKDFQFFKNEIYRCEKNILFKSNENFGFTEHAGNIVNSPGDEVRPVQSPNYLNKFYYSSNKQGSSGGPRNKFGIRDDKYGHHSFDMYAVETEESNWQPVFIFSEDQNTSKNEILYSFNPEGTKGYLMKSEGKEYKSPELLELSFSEDPNDKIPPFKTNISHFKPEAGDKDLFIFNDSLWIFSSKRMGGYGGYDLYYMEYKAGEWSTPVNLGKNVNSSFDEISPFLTRGSRILFYSSNRLDGYGGFDLMFSEFSTTAKGWTEPKNLGNLINSPMDEKELFVSGDGSSAMMSSNREGSLGGFDIYQIFFTEQITDHLQVAESPVFADTALINTQVVVTNVPETNRKKNSTIKKDFVNLPIFYNDSNLKTQIANQVGYLRELLTVYEELEIMILVSKGFDQNRDISLYQSAKTGELIANEILAGSKIQPERISVLGLGSNMPIVSFESNASERFNNRIEFIMINDRVPELNVIEDPLAVNNEILGDGYYPLQLLKSKLTYVVPFATSAQILRSEIVKNERNVVVFKKGGNPNMEYSMAFYKNFQDARIVKNDLLKKNLLNARIRPYIKGRWVDNKDLDALIKQYEDLGEYKKYEIID